MTMKNLSKPLLALFLLAPVQAKANCDFDDFPVMDSMQVRGVMDNANYNNRPLMVRTYSIDGSAQEVIDYYHKQWKGRYDDTSFGIWQQVTTMTDECMMTAQVARETDAMNYGRLVIANPPSGNPRAELGEGVVAPAESVVVSDLQTEDGPKLGRVTVLTSTLTVPEVLDYYATEMHRKSWNLERTFREGEHAVLVFRKGLELSNILVTPAGDMTQILINSERNR